MCFNKFVDWLWEKLMLEMCRERVREGVDFFGFSSHAVMKMCGFTVDLGLIILSATLFPKSMGLG
jgi:hypothetical protein